MSTEKYQNETILEDILLKPSNEIKPDRFAEQAEGAACNGMCHSGACRSFV